MYGPSIAARLSMARSRHHANPTRLAVMLISATVDVSGDLIKDDEAALKALLARQ